MLELFQQVCVENFTAALDGQEPSLGKKTTPKGSVRGCFSPASNRWEPHAASLYAHRKSARKNENASLCQFRFPPRYARRALQSSVWRSPDRVTSRPLRAIAPRRHGKTARKSSI